MTASPAAGEQPATRVDFAQQAAPSIGGHAHGTGLTTQEVWRQLANASFAVVAHSTPGGEPRCSGVVYRAVGQRFFVAVAPDSLKARQIADGQRVSVTVPLRKGGILSMVFPIPPATVTFMARAFVHPTGSLDGGTIARTFGKLLPESRRESACVLELAPEGQFLTYGVGVSLRRLADPEASFCRVPVA